MQKPEELETSPDNSLRKLNVDCIDMYHLPGVVLSDYTYVAEHLVPEMIKLPGCHGLCFRELTSRAIRKSSEKARRVRKQDE